MDSLREVLHKTGVSCSNIAVEVTESAYIEKMHRVNKVLEAINHLGIVIYLDDFGTGYSSLNYLNQLPIQYIKIDKSFIDPIHTQDQRKNLTYTIIQMANTLGLDCIAEGVEVEAQLDKLKAYGCAYVQGYLFDKPLSEADALHKIHTVYEAHVTP